MRDVSKALRTQQVQDGFIGECVWAEPGKMGRKLTGCERRGNSKWKKNCEKGQDLPLFDSKVQHSSARASYLALINCYYSLLCGVYCCFYSADTFKL